MTTEKDYSGWYFLGFVVLIYIITLFVNLKTFLESIIFFKNILITVLPVLGLILVLMALTNYFVKPKSLSKYLGNKSGIKGWLIAIVAGIISSGPIYMWYPLLNDLQKQGMKNGLIATFLYNRAVKIPLLPLLFYYFGLVYSVVLMFVMIIVSVLQGMVIEKLLEVKK